MEMFGIWLAALLSLAIYSFLYKDNPAYKFAEHVFVGVTAGYSVCVAWHKVIFPDVWVRFTESKGFWDILLVALPVIMGLLMYTRFTKKYSWVSRFSMAFVVGAGAGMGVPNVIQGLLIRQTQSTISPIFTGTGIAWNSLIIIVGVVTVLFYFFFSVEHKGWVKHLSFVGILYLMLYFGASFGYTVMARVSLVIGRMRFLILDWAVGTWTAIFG